MRMRGVTPQLAQINVPPAPPQPGSYIPEEMPPGPLLPQPGTPAEIGEPPPPEPTLPIREPGVVNPPQAGGSTWLH